MDGFLKSFQPLWEKFSHEIILISISVLLIITSVIIYTNNNQQVANNQPPITNNQSPVTSHQSLTTKISVEISGAIAKPDVYELNAGARLNDLVKISGGLTMLAEKNYFSRNFNLARILVDQEKIYIPSTYDIENGTFIESQKVLEYLNPQKISQENVIKNTQGDTETININTAEVEELKLLPGVGEATANKIITNRPYSDIQELLTKKAVNKKVFEAISNSITIN